MTQPPTRYTQPTGTTPGRHGIPQGMPTEPEVAFLLEHNVCQQSDRIVVLLTTANGLLPLQLSNEQARSLGRDLVALSAPPVPAPARPPEYDWWWSLPTKTRKYLVLGGAALSAALILLILWAWPHGPA